MGVDNLCLGKKERGLKALRDVAKHADRPEGAWAKAFLSLVQ